MSGIAWQVWVAWVVLWTAGAAGTYALGWLAGREESYDRGYRDGLADAEERTGFWDERRDAFWEGRAFEVEALRVFDFERAEHETR